MSNTLFRKVIAAVSATAIAMSIVAPVSVNAYTDAEYKAATALAEAGVINMQDNASSYRLGDNITRREVAKVTMKLSGKETPETCKGLFSDLDSSDFGCKYAEAMVSNGFAAANDTYRPNDNVSKFEILKFVLKAKGLNKAEGFGDNFQAAYVQAALDNGIISESFTDYNSAAVRGFVFSAGAEAIAEDEVEVELCEILGTCGTDTTTPVETTPPSTTTPVETTTPVTSEEDVLTVEVSASTPNGKTIAGGASNTVVAVYELTAGNSDVEVSNVVLERLGLGDKDTIENVVLTDGETGDRLSNNKSFNSSDDEANISLNSGYVVKAGETRMINVEVTVGEAYKTSNPNIGSAVAAGDRFIINLMEVSASSDVELEGNMESEEFEVANVNASGVTISKDSSVSDPQLGETEAEIFRFAAEMDSEDGTFEKITFEFDNSRAEDAFRNFVLKNDGNVIAETATMSDEYLTFVIEGGFELKDNKKERFVVLADVIGEAGETFVISIDEKNDVTVIEDKFDSTASVTLGTTATEIDSITIEAGEITIVEMDVENDKIREDKDNVNLAKFKIESLAGKNLEIEEFGVQIVVNEGTSPATKISDLLENIELYDVTNSRTYDLSLDGTDDLDAVYSDDNISISLGSEPVTYVVRADTLDDITNFDSVDFTVSFTTGAKVNDTEGGLYIIETEDDKAVTDITPGTITFKKIDGSESGATLSKLSLSNSNAVVGSKDVEMIRFQVEADESSSIDVEQFVLTATTAGALDFDRTTVSQLRLYKDSVSDANLLDSVSGSQISTTATFNDFKVKVPANEEVEFIVTADIVKDTALDVNAQTDSIALTVDASEAIVRDSDGDDVTISGSDVTGRTLTINGLGTLTAVVEDSDVKVKDEKVILAGTEMSDFVAGFELTATNEGILVEELNIIADVKDNVGTLTVGGTVVIADDVNVKVNGVAFTAAATNTSTDTLAGILATAIDANNSLDASATGSVITVTAAENVVFTDVSADANVTLVASNSQDNDNEFRDSVEEIYLIANDGVTTLDSESVDNSSNTVEFKSFSNGGFVVEEGSENVYVKLRTAKIGKNNSGVATTSGITLAMNITEAQGNGSSEELTWGALPSVTGESKEFRIYPVNVATPTVLNTSDKVLSSSFSNKEVARFQLKSVATNNTKANSSTTLETEVEKVRFNLDTLTNLMSKHVVTVTIGGGNDIDANDVASVTVPGYNGGTAITSAAADTVADDASSVATSLADEINDGIAGISAIANGAVVTIITDGPISGTVTATATDSTTATVDSTIGLSGKEFTIERVSPLDSSSNSVSSTLIDNNNNNLLDLGEAIEFDLSTGFGNNNELSTAGVDFVVKFTAEAFVPTTDSEVKLIMESGDINENTAAFDSAVQFGDDDTNNVYNMTLTQKIESFPTLRYDAN